MKTIKTMGQVGLGTLIGVGASMLAALVSGFIAQTRYTDTQITSMRKDNTEVVQRVSALEANTLTMKEDLRDIKIDIKEILKRLPK